MQKEIKIFAFLLALLVFSSFVYAAGSSTNDDSSESTNQETQERTVCRAGGGALGTSSCMNSCAYRQARVDGENPRCTAGMQENCKCAADKCWDGNECVALPTAKQAAASSQADPSNTAMVCSDRATRTERIKCRLENRANTQEREPNWASEESCKNLPEYKVDTSMRVQITKGLCRALYATSKQCYEMQKEGEAAKEDVEKCFQRASGLQKRVSEEFANKEGVRKYLVLRLYNLQEKIENAQEEGSVDAAKAAEAIELIVQIKEQIMNGENKETIRPMIQELKTKIQEIRSSDE